MIAPTKPVNINQKCTSNGSLLKIELFVTFRSSSYFRFRISSACWNGGVERRNTHRLVQTIPNNDQQKKNKCNKTPARMNRMPRHHSSQSLNDFWQRHRD